MSSRSSATFIEFDLRPAKQAERRMILDLLECMKEAGLPVSSYRYVGMGGIKFYDFVMIYRFLGIKDLLSFERKKKVALRARYNRPLGNIRIRREPIGNYLKNGLQKKTCVCWMDYDSPLNSAIVDDIRDLGLNLPSGSAAFVTIACEMPREFIEMTEEERVLELRSDFGDFAGKVNSVDTEEANFSVAYYKILQAVFENAFSARTEADFLPVFRIHYKDSFQMLTFGGAFLAKEHKQSFMRSIRRRLPFLVKAGLQPPYGVRTLNMTERERHLFEFCSTADSGNTASQTLKQLGFADADLIAYRELVRFMPRYFESLV